MPTTATTLVELVPLTWSAERDEPFFRAVGATFPAAFCLGASVLLAGYDAD